MAGDQGRRTRPRPRSGHPRKALAGALRPELNPEGGTSARVARLLLVDEPPSLDGGEITDKAYLNQQAVLRRRRVLVERLLAEPLDPDVITP